MRRIVVVLVVLALGSFALVGCGNDQGSSVFSAKPDAVANDGRSDDSDTQSRRSSSGAENFVSRYIKLVELGDVVQLDQMIYLDIRQWGPAKDSVEAYEYYEKASKRTVTWSIVSTSNSGSTQKVTVYFYGDFPATLWAKATDHYDWIFTLGKQNGEFMVYDIDINGCYYRP